MRTCRIIALAALLTVGYSVATQAGELRQAPNAPKTTATIFSPALPATGSQFLECRIVNVSNVAQAVTTQAFDSTGAVVAGPLPQTLATGESGGFSIPAVAGAVRCTFAVSAPTVDFRASIDVLDSTTTPPHIVVALPAN